MKVKVKTRFTRGLAPKVAIKTLAKAAFALTALAMSAHGSAGRWEARLAFETLGQGEIAVIRIGEERGRMAVTGAEFPAVTVVATAQGWTVVKPGEFATEHGLSSPSFPSNMMKLTFWGSEDNRGLVVAEVQASPSGAWQRIPELSFSQSRGWRAPAGSQEARWQGDIGRLGLEVGGTLSLFEIRYVRSGALFMVR